MGVPAHFFSLWFHLLVEGVLAHFCNIMVSLCKYTPPKKQKMVSSLGYSDNG